MMALCVAMAKRTNAAHKDFEERVDLLASLAKSPYVTIMG